MAIARQTIARLVQPLTGSIVRRYPPGAAIEVGEIVSLQSDGYVDPANTTSADQQIKGIALKPASGELSPGLIDVVIFGPVSALTGATPAATLHATDTAGEPGESAGSNAGVAGVVDEATIAFVNPIPL
jgi:hypothetical protein